MSDPIQETIAKLQLKLRDQERAAAKTKMVINGLCEAEGLPLLYADADAETSDVASLSIRSDQFYGQPLAGAIRTIFELRRKQDRGPATVNEIYAALLDGGFAFETRNEDNAKRGLRVSLTKNSVTFHKLPNGKYGLTEWYPSVKAKRARNATNADAEGDDGDGFGASSDEDSGGEASDLDGEPDQATRQDASKMT